MSDGVTHTCMSEGVADLLESELSLLVIGSGTATVWLVVTFSNAAKEEGIRFFSYTYSGMISHTACYLFFSYEDVYRNMVSVP